MSNEHITTSSLTTHIGRGSYIGIRSQPLETKVYRPDGVELDPRLDLYNHSPTGLEWGYGGSGPAQLALALLAHLVGDHIAMQHYQAFKWKVVARLPRVGWILSPTTIHLALQEITKGKENER